MNKSLVKFLSIFLILLAFFVPLSSSASFGLYPNYTTPGESVDIMKFEISPDDGVDSDLKNITLEYTGTADISNVSGVEGSLTDGDNTFTLTKKNPSSNKFNLTGDDTPLDETQNITVTVNISSDALADNETVDFNVTDVYSGIHFNDSTYADPEGNITLDTKKPNVTVFSPTADKHYNNQIWINASGTDNASGIQTSNYSLKNSDGDTVRKGELNKSLQSSSFSYGNYTARYNFIDNVGFQKIKERTFSLGTLSWDLTPTWARDTNRISIMKFRVNSNGANSTLNNITVGYNGSATIGNITSVSAQNQTGKTWTKSNLNQSIFNLSVNDTIENYENITLKMKISKNATANNKTVDLNVSNVYGTNVSLPEPPADPDGRTMLDTTQPDIGQILSPDKYANISGGLMADAKYSDKHSGPELDRWLISKDGSFVDNSDGSLLQYSFGSFGGVSHLESARDYKVVYQVKDSAGKSTTKTRQITIDNVDPVINSSTVEDGGYYKDVMDINVTYFDNLVGVQEATFNLTNTSGSPPEPNTSLKQTTLNDTFDTTNHKFGEYIVNYSINDFAGNQIYDTRNFYIDNMNPNFTHQNPTGLDEGYYQGVHGSKREISVEATWGTDPPSNLSDSLNNSYWKLINSSGVQKTKVSTNKWFANGTIDTKNVADGEYTIKMNVTDKAGNYNGTTKEIIIDTTPPNVTILSPNISMVDNEILDVTAAWSDNTKVDFPSFVVLNSTEDDVVSGSLNNTLNTSNVTSGFYTIKYLIADIEGNQANKTNETEKDLIIDHLPPEVDQVAPEKVANVSENLTIDAVYSDVHSGMNYTYYNFSNSTYSTNGSINDTINTSNLSNGDYNITMDFVDKLNNTANINRTITVDNTIPKVWNFSINNTPPISAPENPVVLEAEAYANDTVTGIDECNLKRENRRGEKEYSLDYNNSTNRLNTTFTLDGVEGLYNFTVICNDFAENQEMETVMNFSDNTNGSTFYFDDTSPHLENISPEGFLGSDNPTVKADIRDLSGINESSIDVWFNDSNISEFTLDEFNNSQNNSQYALKFSPENITEGERYWVNVSANDTNGLTASNDSLAWNFTVDLTPPQAGNFSLPKYYSERDLKLNWTAGSDSLSGIDRYRVIQYNPSQGTESEYTDDTELEAFVYGGNETFTIEYIDKAGNINSTNDTTRVDLEAPRLESKTQNLTFSSLDSTEDKTVKFTIVDRQGINVSSLNFTFSDQPTERYDPAQNYTDFNVSHNGNYSEKINVNYTVSAEANESYKMTAEASDVIRNASFEWTIGTILIPDDDDDNEEGSDNPDSGPGGGGGSPGGGGAAPIEGGGGENNFTFENSTLDEFDPSNRLELIEVDIPSLNLSYNSTDVYEISLENSGDSTISFDLEVISSYIQTDIRDSITLDPDETTEVPLDIMTGETLPGNYSAGLLLDTGDASVKRTFSYQIQESETSEEKVQITQDIEELESRYGELKEEKGESDELNEISEAINSSKQAISQNELDRASNQINQAEQKINELEKEEEPSNTPWTIIAAILILISIIGIAGYLYYGSSLDLSKVRSEL